VDGHDKVHNKEKAMAQRIAYAKVAPESVKALLGLEQPIERSTIERPLFELVRMRASQINGCAYCLDMHSKDARAAGETEQRLYALNAWHEAPFFTERERAALAWTEALTLVAENHVPDDVYELARKHFDERELVELTLAVVTINAWNRFAIAFRAVAGTYSPRAHRS
jgi:AhpD family alkylhydroperoxidase